MRKQKLTEKLSKTHLQLDSNNKQTWNYDSIISSAGVYSEGVQFGGSVNIIRYEIFEMLKANSSIQVVYYFLFTDGGNTYPMA